MAPVLQTNIFKRISVVSTLTVIEIWKIFFPMNQIDAKSASVRPKVLAANPL